MIALMTSSVQASPTVLRIKPNVLSAEITVNPKCQHRVKTVKTHSGIHPNVEKDTTEKDHYFEQIERVRGRQNNSLPPERSFLFFWVPDKP